MVAERQPIDRVIDVAVGLPVATAVAARRSLPLARLVAREGVRRARRRVSRLMAREPVVGTAAFGETPHRPAPLQVTDIVEAPATFEVLLPIDDYDHLAARQVVDRLNSLTPTELSAVDAYERANRHRQTILGRISQLQP